MSDDIINMLHVGGLQKPASDRIIEHIEALRAENEKLRAALKPFADVAENDIGDDETDADIFRPITGRYNHAPLLTVGDLRTAAAALKETGDE